MAGAAAFATAVSEQDDGAATGLPCAVHAAVMAALQSGASAKQLHAVAFAAVRAVSGKAIGSTEVQSAAVARRTKNLSDAALVKEARVDGQAAGVEGKADEVEEAVPGRLCQVGGGCRWPGKYGEVEILRWRWRGGRNPRIMWEVSVLIWLDTSFIRKESVLANRAGHYISNPSRAWLGF